MEENMLNISEEQLKKLSVEQLADLKTDGEELLAEIDNEIENCKNMLNE